MDHYNDTMSCMDVVFSEGWSFWQIIVVISVMASSVIAIRISFKFDINKYLADRRKIAEQRARNACTYMFVERIGGDAVKCQSLFVSPPGTHQWQCQRCGLVRDCIDNEYEEKMAAYYAQNREQYRKKNVKFRKLLKKAGRF